MKKLRLIATSVVILAIICGAFAFKIKGNVYCILDNSISGTNCTTFVQHKERALIGTQYKYAPFWDGNPTACTAASNGLCTAGPIRIKDN